MTVAMSSTEAEYKALSHATREAIWLCRILGELGVRHDNSTPIFCDNQGCTQLARNHVFHAKTKHIEVHHHYIRDMLSRGEIDVILCRTNEQSADVFTKPLSKDKFQKFRSHLGLIPTLSIMGEC